MVSNTYNRYLWLLNTLLQFKRLTYEQIRDKWERSHYCDGRPLEKRLFHKHKNEIEQMFDINIKCDSSHGYMYYIEDVSSLHKDKARQWLINSYTNTEIVGKAKDLKERIIYEDTSRGSEFLDSIIDSMYNNMELDIVYHAYNYEDATQYRVQPYCLRIFNHRWYLLALLKDRNVLRHFALDRVESIVITEEAFEYPKNFSPEEYYADSVGMWVDKTINAETVVLRSFGLKTKYLRSLPLHHSQKEINTQLEYSDFSYHICITDELVQAILGNGNDLEVLKPQSLRKRMSEVINCLSCRYEDEDQKCNL